jgi:hypothetical protein
MRTGEFALEGNGFLVEGEKYAIRERKKVKGKPKFYLIRCKPFEYVSSLFPVAPEEFSFDHEKKLYSLEKKGSKVVIREL